MKDKTETAMSGDDKFEGWIIHIELNQTRSG